MIRVWEEKEKSLEYYLKLRKSSLNANTARLEIVNEDGSAITCGLLAVIDSNGITIKSNVNKEVANLIGIPLDDRGRICYRLD